MPKSRICLAHDKNETCVYCVGERKTKPCRCNGVNENCMYCFGSGVITAEASLGSQRLYSAGAMAGTIKYGTQEQVYSKTEVPNLGRRNKKRKKVALHATPSTPSELIVCRLCNAKIKASKYNSHITKRCPNRPIQKRTQLLGSDTKAKNTKTSHANSQKNAAIHKTAEDSKFHNSIFEKSLDVTKEYAQAYRENGRFGSHPSHDGFDDESSP